MSKVVVIGLSGESVFLKVDHFNNPGETINAIDRFVEPGGKGYNQAVMLGKLGADVSFITVLGNDSYARECVRVLKEHHVNPCIITKNDLTDYAVITTDKFGENHVIVSNKLSKETSFDDILQYKEVIDEADIVLLQLEYPYQVNKQIIEYCYQRGIKVVLNPAPARLLDKELLGKVSVLIPNEFEVLNILEDEKDILKVLKQLSYCGVATTIVTCGSKNVLSYFNNELKEYPVRKVSAVDTTGAGDTFCAGVVYGLANNMNLTEAINFGICASGLSVTKHGVINSLPSLDDILKILNKE